MSAQVPVSARNPLKTTRHINWCSSASIRATKVSRCHFKDDGQSFFCYKIHFPKKTSVLALDQVQVYIDVLSCFLSASFHTFPLKNFNKICNHLILVTKERIKWKVECRMNKKGQNFPWKVCQLSLTHLASKKSL